MTLLWTDTAGSVGSDKVYVVQTGTTIIQRCILMTTDPGDLVLEADELDVACQPCPAISCKQIPPP